VAIKPSGGQRYLYLDDTLATFQWSTHAVNEGVTLTEDGRVATQNNGALVNTMHAIKSSAPSAKAYAHSDQDVAARWGAGRTVCVAL
jgi:hypothetical protein